MAQENLPKTQVKSNTTKPKKDMGKWCEFHKSSTHNTSECRAKQSLVAEMRAFESDACSYSKSKPDKGNDKGKWIIDAEPVGPQNSPYSHSIIHQYLHITSILPSCHLHSTSTSLHLPHHWVITMLFQSLLTVSYTHLTLPTNREV